MIGHDEAWARDFYRAASFAVTLVVLLKLSPLLRSPTIQAQPGPNVGPFHWENRRLRVPELRRLFTFPDDFEFVGSRASVQAQVGNSVPPLLAEQVAVAVCGT